MPLLIIKDDITKVKCDAIVNAANSSLLGGGGVDGAIHAAAGPELLEECKTLGGCRTGEAKLTGAYRLPAKYVIHTVGPVWRGGLFGEKRALSSCYRSALELAKRQHCESVAFPLISAGVYGYPKDKALAVATHTIGEFLQKNEMLVYLVIYDRNAFEIGKKRFQSLQSVIEKTYVAAQTEEKPSAAPPKLSAQALRSDSTVFIDGDTATVVAPAAGEPAAGNAAPAKQPAFCRRCGYRMRSDLFYCPCCGAEMERPPTADKWSPPVRQRPYGTTQAPLFDAAMSVCREEAPEEPREEAFHAMYSANAPAADYAAGPTASAAQPERDAAPRPAKAASVARKTGEKRAAREMRKEDAPQSALLNEGYAGSLEDALNVLDESFSEMLLRKIDERGVSDVSCYKRANIDRKLFSKIRSDRLYKPRKTTALAFAVALELSPAETRELLMKAGYALSRSSKFDIIVDYYISRGVYDIFEINEALFAFDQPLLS